MEKKDKEIFCFDSSIYRIHDDMEGTYFVCRRYVNWKGNTVFQEIKQFEKDEVTLTEYNNNYVFEEKVE